jgi:beta-phosphoglucomutase
LLLEATGTAGYFSAIVSGDDVTQGKPHPEVFLKGAEQLGVPPERCVVFEDAVAGVAAARAGGMRCVAVTFVGHHPADKLLAAGAEVIVPSLERVSVEVIAGLFATP